MVSALGSYAESREFDSRFRRVCLFLLFVFLSPDGRRGLTLYHSVCVALGMRGGWCGYDACFSFITLMYIIICSAVWNEIDCDECDGYHATFVNSCLPEIADSFYSLANAH